MPDYSLTIIGALKIECILNTIRIRAIKQATAPLAVAYFPKIIPAKILFL